MAANLIGWFSELNAGLFLMRNLFVNTSPQYLSKRNTLKSSSAGLFVADKKTDEKSIFDKFKRQTLLNGLKEDLINRVRFKEQSPITFILGFLCRKKEAVRKMKIFRRSDAKIKADIDILNFINT